MDCDCLFEDLNKSQVFSVEIWIHEIIITKGPHKNVPGNEEEIKTAQSEVVLNELGNHLSNEHVEENLVAHESPAGHEPLEKQLPREMVSGKIKATGKDKNHKRASSKTKKLQTGKQLTEVSKIETQKDKLQLTETSTDIVQKPLEDVDRNQSEKWELRKMNPFKVTIDIFNLSLHLYQVGLNEVEKFLTADEFKNEEEYLRIAIPMMYTFKGTDLNETDEELLSLRNSSEVIAFTSKQKSRKYRPTYCSGLLSKMRHMDSKGLKKVKSSTKRAKSPKSGALSSTSLMGDVVCLGTGTNKSFRSSRERTMGEKLGKPKESKEVKPSSHKGKKSRDPSREKSEGERRAHHEKGGKINKGKQLNKGSQKCIPQTKITDEDKISKTSPVETQSIVEDKIPKEPIENWVSFEKGIFTVFISSALLIIKHLQTIGMVISLFRFGPFGKATRVGKARIRFNPSLCDTVLRMNRPLEVPTTRRVDSTSAIHDVNGLEIGSMKVQFFLTGYGPSRVFKNTLSKGHEGFYKFFKDPESMLNDKPPRNRTCSINVPPRECCARDAEYDWLFKVNKITYCKTNEKK